MIEYFKGNIKILLRDLCVILFLLLLFHLGLSYLYSREIIGQHPRNLFKEKFVFSEDGSLLKTGLAFNDKIYIIDDNRFVEPDRLGKVKWADVSFREIEERFPKSSDSEITSLFREMSTQHRSFLLGKNIRIISKATGEESTLKFERSYLPFAASDGGTLAVWRKTDASGQYAVIYNVAKEDIIREIPIEENGIIWQFALDSKRMILAVGYYSRLEGKPSVVLYNVESGEKIRKLSIR